MNNDNIMRYNSTIKISPSSDGKINSQFALVDILLCYEGRNRNKTTISKQVIEDNLYTLYGIPIIGEWIAKEDGSNDFGTHGGKIIIDDNGIKFEQTTYALGFVPKEAVDNASWVTVTEKDGHTMHEYLKLSKCVVWHERFEEVKTLLDENRPQSMEICVEKSHYDSDDYLVIDDLTFTAACILGSDVTPCFESASIGRHYKLDSVKSDLDLMIKEYQKYKNNSKHKEENTMNCSAIKSKLAEITFKNELGQDAEKYSLICINDMSIGVFDREDCNAYSFDCAEVDGNIVIDEKSKKLSCYSVVDSADNDDIGFSMADEINSIKTVCQAKAADDACKAFAEEYDSKINQMGDVYSQLKAEYTAIKTEYDKLKEADESRNIALHKTEVDNVINTYSKKIGNNPKFLIYRAKIDYSKSVDEINKELTIIAGEAMMDKDSKKQYSYEPIIANRTSDNSYEKFSSEDRYGNLLDAFIN